MKTFSIKERISIGILALLLISLGVYAHVRNHYVTPLTPDNDTALLQIVEEDSIPNTPIHTTPDSTPQRKKLKETQKIETSRKYPGPPPSFKSTTWVPKLKKGQYIDLNAADTTALKRIPGIGSSFARRIVKYRHLLGGFYVVEQLQEVYGMDRERYLKIIPYCRILSPVKPISLSQDSISYHRYLSYRHKEVLRQLLQNNTPFTWEDLMKSGAFTQDDSLRLSPYLHLPKTES